ncbi:MAG: hypothetical protein U0R24_13315 [Solirubrobacterales bacterium]
MLELIAAAMVTAIATGVGAIPVFALGSPSRGLRAALLGSAAGAMTVAGIAGLLIPGIREGGAAPTLVGAALGVGFMFLVRAEIDRAHIASSRDGRAAALVFVVLLAHSLPEGFAIGTAYASETAGLGAFVVAAIAVQNIPEGTSVAIPLAAAGASPARQVWAAIASSMPQPVGAVIAYLAVDAVGGLLPFAFGFAGGAMVAVVGAQTGPDAARLSRPLAALGCALGGGAMLVLDAALGVPT